MDKDFEKLAEDFLFALTGNDETRCLEILKENPEILNTDEIANTLSPNYSGTYIPTPDSYDLALRIVDTLCKYRNRGIISQEQVNNTLNSPSTETGETLLTSVLKETLKRAEKVKNTSGSWHRYALEDFEPFKDLLDDLINPKGKIRLDVNAPNLRGQYPLALIGNCCDGDNLHDLLTTEHDYIRKATNPVTEAKIKHGLTEKIAVNQINDETLPKTKALLVSTEVDPNNPREVDEFWMKDQNEVSVLKVDKPSYLTSDLKEPLSISRIFEPGEYLLRHSQSDSVAVYNPKKLKEWYNINMFLNYGGKWKQIPQDKICETLNSPGGKSTKENTL